MADTIYSIYISIYIFLGLCALPVFTMVLFGYLTYRNIQQTIFLAEHQADRQLARMVFIQVILVIISNTPFSAYMAYSLITASTPKDLNRQIKEGFAGLILSISNYSSYVVRILSIV